MDNDGAKLETTQVSNKRGLVTLLMVHSYEGILLCKNIERHGRMFMYVNEEESCIQFIEKKTGRNVSK